MTTRTTISLRVRYSECDPMNVAHHSAYPVWLEIARTELLREQGAAYADCERRGVLFVVAKLSIRYRKPAYYDDQITIEVEAKKTVGIKIEHTYVLRRGSEVLAKADTTLACVDRDGKVQPLPDDMLP